MGEAVSPPRVTILAEGAFGIETSKTASSLIRYRPERVGSVIDSRFAGRTVQDVIGFGGDIPIVADLGGALALEARPDALLIGIAPQGGALPEAWRSTLYHAMEQGLDLWSGLHLFLADDPEIASRAAAHGRTLHDLRRPPRDLRVGAGRARDTGALRILTVGTDCNVGKMTASLEIRREIEDRGLRAGFAATGQTGILLEGSGIAVDAVVSDFIAGAAERLTIEAASGVDVVLIEGQGSLMHPGYSGVTLGLLHGSMPQGMILCWMPSRSRIFGGNHGWVEIPPVDEAVRRYEDALSWVCPDVPGKVVGIAVTTYEMEEREARDAVERATELTGLPATDPIRFGAGPLAEAVLARRAELTSLP